MQMTTYRAPILKDEGKVKKIFLRWLAGDSKCLRASVLRKQLKETHHWFFLSRPKRFQVCLQTHLFFSGDVLSLGDIRTCEDELEFVPLSDELIEIRENALKIINRYEGRLGRDAWSKFVAFSEPLSPQYSGLQINNDYPRSLLSDRLMDRINSVQTIKHQEWFKTLVPVVENGSVSYWESNTYDKDSVLQSSYRIGRTPVDTRFDNSINKYKSMVMAPSIDAISEVVEEKDIVDLLLLNQRFKHMRQLQFREQVLTNFDSIEEFENVNSDVRLIDLAMICGCDASDKNCLNSCRQQVISHFSSGLFLQDRYHVRKSESISYLNYSVWSKIGRHDYDFATKYSASICTDVSSKKEALRGIPGGNMFVVDRYLFLGRDELDKYLKYPQLREFIGLNRGETDVSFIEAKLLEAVFEDTSDKKVVWIGNPEQEIQRFRPLDLSYKFSQPIYHIDLFFHPIGRLKNGKFCYIFAMPRDPDAQGGSNHDYLHTKMDEVKRILESELSRDDEVVVLDALIDVYYKSNEIVKSYSNYLNGLSEQDVLNGRVEFLQPITQADYVEPYKSRFEEFQDTLSTQASGNGFKLEFTEVEGYFGTVDGLRCQVKVLDRNY